MLEVVLTHPTPTGSEEISIVNERTSFGRGSDSDYYFDDDGLSRLHATIYRDGDRIWIVDENSTNGTLVNGISVPPSGTPLNSGDAIKIGNSTTLNVRISAQKKSSGSESSAGLNKNPVTVASSGEVNNYIIPIAIIAFAVLIIGISGVFVGISVFGGGKLEITRKTDYDLDEPTTDDDQDADSSPSPTPESKGNLNSDSTNSAANSGDFPESSKDSPIAILPPGKTYMQMSDSVKNQYVEIRSQKVARIIGNKSGGAIPAAAVA